MIKLTVIILNGFHCIKIEIPSFQQGSLQVSLKAAKAKSSHAPEGVSTWVSQNLIRYLLEIIANKIHKL
jgi:hypothetical protein